MELQPPNFAALGKNTLRQTVLFGLSAAEPSFNLYRLPCNAKPEMADERLRRRAPRKRSSRRMTNSLRQSFSPGAPGSNLSNSRAARQLAGRGAGKRGPAH